MTAAGRCYPEPFPVILPLFTTHRSPTVILPVAAARGGEAAGDYRPVCGLLSGPPEGGAHRALQPSLDFVLPLRRKLAVQVRDQLTIVGSNGIPRFGAASFEVPHTASESFVKLSPIPVQRYEGSRSKPLRSQRCITQRQTLLTALINRHLADAVGHYAGYIGQVAARRYRLGLCFAMQGRRAQQGPCPAST